MELEDWSDSLIIFNLAAKNEDVFAWNMVYHYPKNTLTTNKKNWYDWPNPLIIIPVMPHNKFELLPSMTEVVFDVKV